MDSQAISFVALGLTVVGLLVTHLRTKSFSDLLERVAKIETRWEVYIDFQEKYNAQILHRSDDKDDVDRLLEKRQELQPLDGNGDRKLDRTLEEIIGDPKEAIGRRAAAAAMLTARKVRDVKC